jgi:hypothetical protein
MKLRMQFGGHEIQIKGPDAALQMVVEAVRRVAYSAKLYEPHPSDGAFVPTSTGHYRAQKLQDIEQEKAAAEKHNSELYRKWEEEHGKASGTT